MANPNNDPNTTTTQTTSSWCTILTTAIGAVILALIVIQINSFDAAPYPPEELAKAPSFKFPKVNAHTLHGSEIIGEGQLMQPEDILYDPKLDVIHTGCADGWVKRIRVNDSVIENWVNTGGRPLGLAHGYSDEIYVADDVKGILKITKDGEIEVLSTEAEGIKYGMADSVTVSKKGVLYFTDASMKYSMQTYVYDFLEGRPYGRLMSYDLSTKETKVLLRDLYFPNGAIISHDEEFIIYCESPMMRCMRYYIQGEKEGTIDVFIDRLPGMPDNIHTDDLGRYSIAIPKEHTYAWDIIRRYPYIRKVYAFLQKYFNMPFVKKNGGTIFVDKEGKPLERFYDPGLKHVSTGKLMKKKLYLGTLYATAIFRLDLAQYPATATSP
uniref:protein STRICTOSIDINE SYNTHASE-LIKE 7-like n=1 Tax=Erigeron canadensis TaxID=72917 RepID=UPI001CB9130B|nr:protein STRICTOSIDINE SYNTHASE-LIKE 7-like [Erigeron canadensis]